MRSLIIGASGTIGSALLRQCEFHRRTHLGTWYRTPQTDCAPLDIRDAEAVEDLIADLEPEVVYLAAGISDPGYAEDNPGECEDINLQGAVNVARSVQRLGGQMVLFTPASIFGDCRTARREDDEPAPRSVHGQFAVECERRVRDLLPGRHLIARTDAVFGSGYTPHHFENRVLQALDHDEPFTARVDRFIQPTFADDLATAVNELTQRGYSGTYHIAGPERISEFTFARLIAFISHMNADLVVPGTADRPIQTPAFSPWLDRFKLRSILGMSAVRFPADGLRAFRDRMRAEADSQLRLRAA